MPLTSITHATYVYYACHLRHLRATYVTYVTYVSAPIRRCSSLPHLWPYAGETANRGTLAVPSTVERVPFIIRGRRDAPSTQNRAICPKTVSPGRVSGDRQLGFDPNGPVLKNYAPLQVWVCVELVKTHGDLGELI
eukprot:764919-Prorocentrum_minimum.AAC.1